MRLSNSYFLTLKEDVKGEECTSANLLVRAGMIKKIGSGIYTFLPMGLKVLRKIENIVREEMNRIDSQELLMPSLLPEDIYVSSGRRDVFGHDMFSLKDRFERDYVLGPTHEELFVDAAREVIKSYKDMPISLYQMADKFRDEPRSRYGLIRTREFIMKDAYTFDKDLEGLDVAYHKMFEAYKRIFDCIGIDYRIVKASTGAMGGLLSEEFQAVTDIGEDILVLCDHCGLSTNIEICECKSYEKVEEEEKEYSMISTPNMRGIDEIVENIGVDIKRTVKTLIYKSGEDFYAVLVRGDRDVNELKLANALGVSSIELASIEEDERITGANVGFAGPIGLTIPVIVDLEVSGMKNFMVGANKTDYHYENVNLKDFDAYLTADIRNVCESDKCPVCGEKLTFKHGIEVGNTFKLGTKYCESMGLQYSDANNELKYPYMGCYGIGIARCFAAVIEQNHDENGIIFPKSISPFDLHLVVVNNKDEDQKRIADSLYQDLLDKGYDVLYDDRNARAGVKFGDADLIGIPVRITVGRDANEGKVELKERMSNESKVVLISDLFEFIKK
ncbi:MAG: proline--tRNA ligase [Bacilli bacterium]|nr:proline--tRNA ligase [Bacilli bacterium]